MTTHSVPATPDTTPRLEHDPDTDRSDRFAPRSYCLRICLCGEHKRYRPLPVTIPPAGRTTGAGADNRQATSWADRDQQTWIDR